MKALNFKPKRVLITAKAYPHPSVNYRETVCCAGVDLETYSWIRLYPIPFRDLDYNKQFKKYSIVEAECAKASDDTRPESFRIKPDSINILDHLDTRDRWSKRADIVLRLPVKTHCQVLREQEEQKLSLGLIKPSDVSFYHEERRHSDPAKRKRAYAQGKLFGKELAPIEEIPHLFYFRFSCRGEAACPGHALSIIDWEINQAYRQWRESYSSEEKALKMITDKWMGIIDGSKNDVFFYVGNLHINWRIFTNLGVFYPPLKKS